MAFIKKFTSEIREWTGSDNSGYEVAFHELYRAFQITSACATGWGALTRTRNVIQQVKPIETAGRWTIVNKMVTYSFSIEGGVSAVNAAGVIIVETFNVIINVSGLWSPPGSGDNPDMEKSEE